VRRFAKYVGGGAANIAVGVAKLGMKSALISGVSDDDLGDFIIEYLARENVETKFVKKMKEAKTGIVFAEAFPGKDGKFIFYRENAADLLITERDVDNEAVRNSKVLVTTGTGLSANPSRDSNYHAMELAKKNGRVNLLNLDWRPTLWKPAEASSRVGYYARATGLADVIVGNDKEYMASQEEDTVDKAISKMPNKEEKILVLTRGESGSRAYRGKQIIDAPPFKVDSLKTLGAGDGVIAGFLYGYLQGWDLYKTTRFGNAVGAIVVTRHSCSEAMPTYDETMMFIEKYGGW
jgi:5-dehydro-2-deoxygluconokinase